MDFAGPNKVTLNDAAIVKGVLKDSHLLALLRPDDVLVVDRGFRDSVEHMQRLGYRVEMPAMLNGRKPLPTEEANQSRRVTKVRWVVEAIHGIVGGRFKLLHHMLDNKLCQKSERFAKSPDICRTPTATRFRVTTVRR